MEGDRLSQLESDFLVKLKHQRDLYVEYRGLLVKEVRHSFVECLYAYKNTLLFVRI